MSAPAPRGASAIREFFLLTEAAAHAARRSDESRVALAEAIGVAVQRADAADALWARGHTAEALRLAVDAFDATLAAAEQTSGGRAAEAGPADRGGRWASAARAHGLGEANARTLETLARSIDPGALPVLDGDVSPRHAELFRDVIAAQRRISRGLGPSALSPAVIARTRWVRWAVLTGGVVAALVGTFLLVRTPLREVAIASAVYASRPEYQPSGVLDGDPDTEWFLPAGREGWVEVRLEPPRDLSRVRLRNAHDGERMHQATERYTLELWNGDAIIQSREGSFAGLESSPEWQDVDVEASGVERIRVVVQSWHGPGGGLADIDWD